MRYVIISAKQQNTIFDPDPATLRFDHSPGDRRSEAQAAGGLVHARFSKTEELIEHPFPIGARYAFALVFDDDPELRPRGNIC